MFLNSASLLQTESKVTSADLEGSLELRHAKIWHDSVILIMTVLRPGTIMPNMQHEEMHSDRVVTTVWQT